jgi:hypothetical protein
MGYPTSFLDKFIDQAPTKNAFSFDLFSYIRPSFVKVLVILNGIPCLVVILVTTCLSTFMQPDYLFRTSGNIASGCLHWESMQPFRPLLMQSSPRQYRNHWQGNLWFFLSQTRYFVNPIHWKTLFSVLYISNLSLLLISSHSRRRPLCSPFALKLRFPLLGVRGGHYRYPVSNGLWHQDSFFERTLATQIQKQSVRWSYSHLLTSYSQSLTLYP